ncbi:MAG: hypothetical protein KAR40_11185 [Candidatus Sabulitectum sp.]|nr:hypothetical protein [Candidatus Sabulitectum sp.]
MFYAYGRDKGLKLTRLEVWKKITAKTGRVKIELTQQPDIRVESLYLWSMYCAIKKGCEAVTWESIGAYQRLTRVQLKPWESMLMIDIEAERRKPGKEVDDG